MKDTSDDVKVIGIGRAKIDSNELYSDFEYKEKRLVYLYAPKPIGIVSPIECLT